MEPDCAIILHLITIVTHHKTHHDKRGMIPCMPLLLHQSTQLETVTFPVMIELCIRDKYTQHQACIGNNHLKLGSEVKWANPQLNVGNCLKSSKMD